MKNLELQNQLNQKSKEQFYLKVHSETPEYVKDLYKVAIRTNLNVKDILHENRVSRTQYEFMCKNYMSIPEYRKTYFGRSKNYMCDTCANVSHS